MAQYKMPFNEYKACQKMSQKEFSRWLETFGRESWKQGYEKALEQVPDGAIVVDTNNTVVVEMDYDRFRETLLSVPGVGTKLCEKIIDKIYEAFDGYVSEGGTEE